MVLKLVKPTIELEPEYLAMVDEYREVGESYPYTNTELARQNFAGFIQELEAIAQGMNNFSEIRRYAREREKTIHGA